MNKGWREAVHRRALVIPDSGVNFHVWPQVSAQGQERGSILGDMVTNSTKQMGPRYKANTRIKRKSTVITCG